MLITSVTGLDLNGWANEPEPFKYEATVSTGYTDISSIVNWGKFYKFVTNRKNAKAEIKIFFDATTWTSLSAEEKIIVAEFHLVDYTKRNEVLTDKQKQDSTEAERESGLERTTPPTVNCDSSQGYRVDDIITDTTSQEIYACTSSSDGVAVWKKISNETSSSAFAMVQTRRNTTFSVPNGTPTSINFDETEVENAPSIISHNDVTDTDRIYLNESEYYFGSVNLSFENTSNTKRIITLEMYLNGTTLMTSIPLELTKSSEQSITRTLIIPPLTAGDFIGIRLGADGTGVTLQNKAVVQVIQQKALRGATGQTGSGANIIVQSEGVTQGTVTDTIDFVGESVSVSEVSGKSTVTLNGNKSYTVGSSTGITTNDATWKLVTGMTITPPAGDYDVNFTSSGMNDLAGAQLDIQIYVDGVEVADTRRYLYCGNSALQNSDFNIATNGLVSVNGSQAIEIFWRVQGTSVVATLWRRTLVINKTII